VLLTERLREPLWIGRLFCHRVKHGCIDGARQHTVGADALGRVVDRERASQTQQAVLADDVVDGSSRRGYRLDRSDKDDRAAAAPSHAGNAELGHEERAAQVHTKHAIPILLADRLHRAVRQDAGTVHQHIDRPKGLVDRGDDTLDLSSLRDVADEQLRFGTRCPETIDECLSACSVTIDQGDPGASFSQDIRGRLADARGAASDDCDAVPALSHDALSVFPAGSTTVTFTATDASGNTAQAGAEVQVTYPFGGFSPPLLADGSASIKQSKQGRTIPTKFTLTLPASVISGAVAHLSLYLVMDVATGTVDTTDLTDDSGSSGDSGTQFRYDPVDEQYIFNLSTKDLAADATYRLTVTLDDGSEYSVDFSLR
jgi:hypothetical protein